MNSGYSFLVLAALVIAAPVFVLSVHGQDGGSDSDLQLLSQRYNQGQFGDEIVGELLNNSTRGLEMFDVTISAPFYDSAGQIVSTENGYLESAAAPGDKAAFTVSILDPAAVENAATYDLVINGERLVQGAPLSGSADDEDDED
jgi:hypothetical protein